MRTLLIIIAILACPIIFFGAYLKLVTHEPTLWSLYLLEIGIIMSIAGLTGLYFIKRKRPGITEARTSS